MKGASALFRFLRDGVGHGEAMALVTITDVIGTSSREPGTHMAVSASGSYAGALSGGCVEAAVVAEAQRVIGSGRAELLRFGLGSPFIDIRLPCGGGLDLLITPAPALSTLQMACSLLEARQSMVLHLGADGSLGVSSDHESFSPGWKDEQFQVRHDPDLRLIIIGHGAETEALSRIGAAYGADILVLSPDADIVAAVRRHGAQGRILKTPSPSPHLVADAHSAIVMLFHDHDWEGKLLAQALSQNAFYIGAMGSRATHARRLEMLASFGVTPAQSARVRGPIGLIPATRDPDTLALSTLSEIVEARRRFRSEGSNSKDLTGRSAPTGRTPAMVP